MITFPQSYRTGFRVAAFATFALIASLSNCDAGPFGARAPGVGGSGFVGDLVRTTGQLYGERQQAKAEARTVQRWAVDMAKIQRFNRELVRVGCDTDTSCEALARKHGLDPEMLDAITDCENGNRRACRLIGEAISIPY